MAHVETEVELAGSKCLRKPTKRDATKQWAKPGEGAGDNVPEKPKPRSVVTGRGLLEAGKRSGLFAVFLTELVNPTGRIEQYVLTRIERVRL